MFCVVCQQDKSAHFGEKSGHKLEQCRNCGLIFVNPMPTAEQLSAFYDSYHKTDQYQSKLPSKIRRASRRIGRIKRKTTGLKFVDVGCNTGFAVIAAANQGFDASGIDIDEKAVNWAAREFPQCRFEAISVEALADRGEKFDLIYCSEVIEHLADLEGFVSSLKLLMTETSVLYMTTPDIGHYSLARPFSWSPLLEWDAIRPPEHLFYFNRHNLERLLHRHGFGRVDFEFNTKPTIKATVRLKSL